jgi:uncharacterized HhH-GPD family protein
MAAIYFTDDPEANALLASDPFAMLVGLTLYQQVPVEKAFAGPFVLRERLGGNLDPATIARMDPEALDEVFRDRPALHRFPGSMAKRTQAVAGYIEDTYSGDVAFRGSATTKLASTPPCSPASSASNRPAGRTAFRNGPTSPRFTNPKTARR